MLDKGLNRRERSKLAISGNDDIYRYVDVTEFIELATSTRKLIRADASRERLAGLLDVTTGERMVVERERLIEANTMGAISNEP